MSGPIIIGQADNGWVTGLLLDEGGRFVNLVDAPANVSRVMLPQTPMDEAVVSRIVPEHRPKVGKRRFFERRGPDLKLPHSQVTVRRFVEVKG